MTLLTGFYLSILNIDEHNRSQRNGIMTIQFVKNSQIKSHGMNKCLEKLVKDLNELIENGFLLPNNKRTNVRVVQYRCGGFLSIP